MKASNLVIVKKINSKTKKILYSKGIVIFVLSFTLLVSILSIILFINGGTIADNTLVDFQNNNKVWLVYIWFFIAIVSSGAGIIGDVLIHRNDKKCFIFYFIFIVIYIFNGLILQLWFETIEQFVLFFIVTFAYFSWGSQSKNTETKIKSQSIWSLVFTMVMVILFTYIFGWLMVAILGDTNYSDRAAYLDAFIMVTFFAGWILMSRKIINAYIFYLLCTIATMVLFIYIGAWIYVGTNVIYLGLYAMGIFNWLEIKNTQ